MANISVSLPSDGETVDVADYNTPINTIVNEINGSLDNSNITAAAAIAGSKLADASVPSSKLSLGAAGAAVDTAQTTTSTSYANLSTVGPAVTVIVGANGLLLVGYNFSAYNSTASLRNNMSIELSGANTISAGSSTQLEGQFRDPLSSGNQGSNIGNTTLLTGLNPGSTTLTAKYQVQGGTGTFASRSLWALPLQQILWKTKTTNP